jgi:hypothetical protein
LKPRYVAEKVEDSEISEELKRRFRGKWVVYEPFAGEAVIYDYYDSEEEAKKEAELLNMAEKVIEDIRDAAAFVAASVIGCLLFYSLLVSE